MGQLHEKLHVQCPMCQAVHHLRAFFSQHAPSGKDTIILPLLAIVPLIGAGSGLNLERNVKLTVRHADRQYGTSLAVFDIDWEVESPGPYPHFSGTISICPDEDYNKFILSLDGSYVAPFGPAGKAFDATVGHAIGRSTIINLLTRIRDFIQAKYHETEDTKAEEVKVVTHDSQTSSADTLTVS